MSVIILISSCENKSELANKNFIKRYGDQVDEINKKRDEFQKIQSNQNSNRSQSDSIDTSKIIMPNDRNFSQEQSGQLPENMFQISYNLYNFPESYGRSRISFDDIIIPKNDSFGVKTELGEKSYQLVGNQTLQQDIDFTKQAITQDDKEVSLELIKQEKQIRRKGNTKISIKEPEIEEIKTNPDKMTKVEIKSDKITNQTPDKALNSIVEKVTDQINKTISGSAN